MSPLHSQSPPSWEESARNMRRERASEAARLSESGLSSLSSPSLKVLVATSPSGKTSYPSGTLLQSPESLHEAVIRASLSMGGPLHGLEEGEEEEEEEEGGGREEGSGRAEP